MQKIAVAIQKFVAFIDKYGVLFHSLSIVFWLWILNMNVTNPKHDSTELRVSFYITIAFIVLSSFNLIVCVRRKLKKA